MGLNLIPVFGAGPIAPLATVIVFASLSPGMALYVARVFPDRRRYGIGGGASAPAPPLSLQARMGLASGASFFLEAGAFAAMTLIVGRPGALTLAAHGVLFQFLALTFMVAYGIAGATQVRVGNAWGRGDPRGMGAGGDRPRARGPTGAATAIYAAFPQPFLRLFTSEAA